VGECWNKAFSDGGARVDKLSLSVPGRRERSDISVLGVDFYRSIL
jgi:hypothetical protein